MPTYEYECSACGHHLEEFQSMSAKPLKKCPECGKSTLTRLIGLGAGIIFKGGGFYETDYRSDSYKKSAEADTKSSAPAKSDGEAAKTGHTHTDSCGCGQKSKTECASGASGAPTPARPTTAQKSPKNAKDSKKTGSSRTK